MGVKGEGGGGSDVTAPEHVIIGKRDEAAGEDDKVGGILEPTDRKEINCWYLYDWCEECRGEHAPGGTGI